MALRSGSSLQFGWTGTDLVAWWWDGRISLVPTRSSIPASRLYNELISGWGQLPAGSSACRIRVTLPDGEAEVPAITLPFVNWPRSSRFVRTATDSARWIAEVIELARHLLGAGHVMPVVHQPAREPWRADWVPLDSPALDDAVATLAHCQPPVCRAASTDPAVDARSFTQALLASAVDSLARHALRQARWSPPLKGRRGPEATAARAVGNALVRADAWVPHLKPDPEATLPSLADGFALLRARATGEPVVTARLRLSLPDPSLDDSDAEFGLTIELVDRTDGSRWCTASDVRDTTPLAMDLAGEARFLANLAGAARGAADRLLADEALAPVLSAWHDDASPGRLPLDVVAASTLLEAVPRLMALGIDLHVPGQLLPVTAKVRGSARPAAATGGKLSARSLVDWSMVVGEDSISEAALDRAVTAGSSLLQVNGRWVRLDRAAARRALEELVRHRADHAEIDPLTLLRLATATDDDLLEIGAEPADLAEDQAEDQAEGADRSWVRELLNGLPDTSLREGTEPAGFEVALRPYQRRGLGWLEFLAELGFGACLADDMGLGKTPTTLAHLCGRPGPHLVVCPLSVVRNWHSEAARFTPFMRTVVHHGTDRLRGSALRDVVAGADLVISTYGLVTRDVDELAGIEWSTFVLDEAQAIKNAHTKAARAVRKIGAGQKIALTGTPVENRLGELWSILDVVNPGLLGSERRFHDRWAVPIERDQDLDAAEELRRLTGPFVLRRTKADKSLVPDLPDKVEQVAWATLTKEQGAMYQAVVDELLKAAEDAEGMQRRGLVLGALTRLKQICNHPAQALRDGSRLTGRSGKLARFEELVVDLLEAEQRALVFTQYREMGLLLQRHLADRFGVSAPFLHGGVAKNRRDRMVDEFQAGGGAPLLLVSLKAGGTGLNLTAASRVVHYDRWWNPAVEDQATDRAWRIGQHQSVFVHKLVCQGTLEERIAQVIDDKRRLAGMVVGNGEAWVSELDTDQLRDLVVLGSGALG